MKHSNTGQISYSHPYCTVISILLDLSLGENEHDPNDPNESQFLDENNLGNLSDGDLADSFNSDEPSKIELTQKELSQLQIVTHSLNSSR